MEDMPAPAVEIEADAAPDLADQHPDYPGAVVTIPPSGIPLDELERMAILEALRMSNWIQKRAAELLSVSPRVINYKIKVLGIHY